MRCLGKAATLIGDKSQAMAKDDEFMLTNGDQLDALLTRLQHAVDDDDKAKAAADIAEFQASTGCMGRPALHALRQLMCLRMCTLHDFMHAFYNAVKRMFSFVIGNEMTPVRRRNYLHEERYIAIGANFVRHDFALRHSFAPSEPTRMLFEASKQCLIELSGMWRHRRVPTNDEHANLDRLIDFDKQGKPCIDLESSAAYIHMAGPIGVYYIHAVDIHPGFKEAFSDLLWVLCKLRRRFVTLSQVNAAPTDSYVRWLRRALARLEMLMPVHFCTINLHLLQHVPRHCASPAPCMARGTWRTSAGCRLANNTQVTQEPHGRPHEGAHAA